MTNILLRRTQKGRSFDYAQLLKEHTGLIIEYSIDDHAGEIILEYLRNSPLSSVLLIDDVVLSQVKDITKITGVSP
jgi:hypothetical protein